MNEYEKAIRYLESSTALPVCDASLIGCDPVTGPVRLCADDPDEAVCLAHALKEGGGAVRLVRDEDGLFAVWRSRDIEFWNVQPGHNHTKTFPRRRGGDSHNAFP